MAQASLTRTVRAAGIVQRQECIPVDAMDGWYQVSDTGTGSGKHYMVSLSSCNCPDYTYRGNVCKHIQAARAEHTALMAYAASWDALGQPQCPMCGQPMIEVSYYVGGRGYVFVEVCAGDASHVNRRG